MDILYRIIPKYAYPYYSLPFLPEIIFGDEQPEAIPTSIIRNVSAYSYAKSIEEVPSYAKSIEKVPSYAKNIESAQSFIVTRVRGNSSI
jgi:hypothetical protein